MTRRIYLDNNASTPVDPRVIQAMAEDLEKHYGNPSSVHFFGQVSRKRLTQARDLIADYLKVKPKEIMFTSGGTEAINMILRGYLQLHPHSHVITSTAEHSAVFSTLKSLEKGCQIHVDYLSPGLWGAIKPNAVKQAIRPNTRLIALMAVNNETGVKTDIEAISEIAKETGVPLFVDGVALLGKELFTIPEGVSFMAFSGHKFHGPKGIGFAYVKSSEKLSQLLTGGDQEFGRRGGTENMTGIIGLAKAIEILKKELPASSERMASLRDFFESELTKCLSGVSVNGQGPRVCNTVNLSFEGIEGENLLMALDLEGIAVSHGSACSSGALEPSRILLNMGVPAARSSVRFSLSRFTTREEIEAAVGTIVRLVNSQRIK